MKTAIQELFSQLEIEHPALFNTNTLEGRQFVNDYYKFFELEKKQISNTYIAGRVDQQGKNSIFYNRKSEDYYNDTFKIETK